MIHEINNPLSTISVNLDLLKEELQMLDGEGVKTALRKVDILKNETTRLKKILDEFRSLTKGLNLNLTDTNLNDLVEELLDFVSPDMFRHDINIMKHLKDGLPTCKADKDLLKQALLNILKNAREAMEEGGEIMVRTWNDDKNVYVSITDTGSGIPPAKLERIWDPYFSTKKGGSGLGLPTTRRIIEEHGGHIEVISEEGKGSSFIVALPWASSPHLRRSSAAGAH